MILINEYSLHIIHRYAYKLYKKTKIHLFLSNTQPTGDMVIIVNPLVVLSV